MPIRATTTLIHATIMPLLVSLLVTLLLVQAAQSASTQPVPWHPCALITAACTQPSGTWRSPGLRRQRCAQAVTGNDFCLRGLEGPFKDDRKRGAAVSCQHGYLLSVWCCCGPA